MKRIVLVLTSIALMSVACAPSPPPPPLPPAGCYAGWVPFSDGGSIYFTGLAPTPWTPNITAYRGDPDCSPDAPAGDFSAVSAVSESDALVACLNQTGKLTLASVPVSTYFGVYGFDNVWMCFPWP